MAGCSGAGGGDEPVESVLDGSGGGSLDASGAGSGGHVAVGGSRATGGSQASGGSRATGGSQASGGSNASGGSQASGGASGTGDGGGAAYNPCPPQGSPCKIMPLGDSITAGAGSADLGSYREPLFHLSLVHNQSITFVGGIDYGPDTVDGVAFPRHCEGHGGFTIDDGGGRWGLSNLVPNALTTHKPHIVTLMIGTNDVDIQLDLANAPARLGHLLDSIATTNPDLLLVLSTIVPTTDDAENVRVVAYNDAMPAMVKARADAGKHIVLVDMYGAFKANPSFKTEYMNDKLHPKEAGYAKMADVWYAAIGGLFH
jgi:hypothetical protein